VDSNGRTIWIADAHRDGKRYVVRADEKLTAFLELEAVISAAQAAFRNTATKFRVRSFGVTIKACMSGKALHEH
jgi:hypothetical protein